MIREQPFLFSGATWIQVWDGNLTAAAVYDRHYSRNPASRQYTEAAADAVMVPVRTALQRMLDGTAEPLHFTRVATAINVAGIRAQQIGQTPEVEAVLAAAGQALTESQGIHERHGRYGMTGPGRQAITAGIDAYEAILRASSPRQMHEADMALMRYLDQRIGRLRAKKKAHAG